MPLAELSLPIPGTGRAMRLAAAGLVSTRALEDSPLVVTWGGRPTIVYDATALAEALGPMWGAVEPRLGALVPATAHAELRARAAEGSLPEALLAPLAEAEAGVVEGDPCGVAALLLVRLAVELAEAFAAEDARAPVTP